MLECQLRRRDDLSLIDHGGWRQTASDALLMLRIGPQERACRKAKTGTRTCRVHRRLSSSKQVRVVPLASLLGRMIGAPAEEQDQRLANKERRLSSQSLGWCDRPN